MWYVIVGDGGGYPLSCHTTCQRGIRTLYKGTLLIDRAHNPQYCDTTQFLKRRLEDEEKGILPSFLQKKMLFFTILIIYFVSCVEKWPDAKADD